MKNEDREKKPFIRFEPMTYALTTTELKGPILLKNKRVNHQLL